MKPARRPRIAAIDRSIAVLSGLVEAHPEVAEYRSDLAGSQALQGLPAHARRQEGRGPGLRTVGARAMFQKLTDDFPAVISYRRELGRSDINIGYTLEELKRLDEALISYRLALATFQSSTTTIPPSPSSARRCPTSITRWARPCRRSPAGRSAESLDRARVGFQKLADDNPAFVEVRYMLGAVTR